MDGKQMRFTDGELEELNALYGGESGEKRLKLLRKVFLPVYDPDAPLGQTIHLPWLGVEALSQMAPSDRELWFMSTVRLTKHIEQQLLQLEGLAKIKKDTPEEKAERQKKDSVK